MMPTPSAPPPYFPPSAPPPYFPPSFSGERNVTSPLQPALDSNGMNKRGLNSMMEMNMLNRVNQIDVNGQGVNVGTSRNFTTTSFIVSGTGTNYFSPSPHPISMNCPHCKNDIVTSCKPTTGCFTHMVAGGLCFLGFYLCFCCPYFINTFKDIEHHCPQCGWFIGVYKRFS